MIEIQSISKHFIQNNLKTKVLDQLNFRIQQKEIFGLLGPNGAGKTTALRIIAGILEADEGQILFNGENIKDNLNEYKRKIGFLSSGTQLYPLLNGKETLTLFGSFYGLPKTIVNENLEKLIEPLGLQDLLNKKINSMSTGQKQRINIGRALIHDPEFLILDEPTNGLDILSSSSMIDLIKSCKDLGKIIIYSTHILSEIELLADTIGIIYEGKLLCQNNLNTILENSNCQNLSNAFLKIIEEYKQSKPTESDISV